LDAIHGVGIVIGVKPMPKKEAGNYNNRTQLCIKEADEQVESNRSNQIQQANVQ